MAEAASMTPAEVLEKALELLGPNGERWGKSPLSACECCDTAICIVAARNGVNTVKPIQFFLRAIFGRDYRDIWDWNDSPSRTFPEVEAAFKKAIALAKEAKNG